MLNTSLITKEEDFLNLEPEWNPLLRQSRADNIFLTWEWISTWWKVFGEGKQPHILTFRDNGKLAGIFPCHIRSRSLLRLGKIRELRFIGTGETVRSEYPDLICLPERQQECLERLLDFLSRDRDWDVAVLADLKANSLLGEFLPARLEKCEIVNREPCYRIKIPGDFETYLKGIDSRMRRNIRNRRRNLEREFSLEYHRLNREENLAEWMAQFERLHNARLQERGLPGKFSDHRYDLFHSRVSRIFQDRGLLYASDLRLDGKMVAARYNFLYNEKVYDYQTGYDPRYGRKGVMQALISYIVEECSTENIKEFDFLAGAEDYKRRFSTGRGEVFTLRTVNSTPRGLIHERGRKLKNRVRKTRTASG